MMKKILLLLLGFSLITYCSIFNISALDTTLNYEQKHFIDLCFTDRFIIYEGNTEITNQFIKNNQSLYDNKDYEKLYKIVTTDGYSFIEKNPILSTDFPSQRLGLEWTWNSFRVVNNYKGEPNTVIYKCEVKYDVGSGAYYEHKSSPTIQITYNGNISKASTKYNKTPILDLSKKPGSVTYDFGIYIVHTDGTYFDPPEKYKVTVLCAPIKNQPNIQIYR